MQSAAGSLRLEDASAKLSGALRVLLAQLKLELDHLQMRIDEADAVIKKTAGDNAPTPCGDPWHRTDYGDRNHCCDRQRSSFQKGARVLSLARNRPGRIYHRWQAKAAGD
jgi:hypothetical protein